MAVEPTMRLFSFAHKESKTGSGNDVIKTESFIIQPELLTTSKEYHVDDNSFF